MDTNTLTLKINNEGKINLDCFWIVPKEKEAMYYTWNIKQGDQDERTLNIEPTQDKNVEIFPCLISNGKINHFK